MGSITREVEYDITSGIWVHLKHVYANFDIVTDTDLQQDVMHEA